MHMIVVAWALFRLRGGHIAFGLVRLQGSAGRTLAGRLHRTAQRTRTRGLRSLVATDSAVTVDAALLLGAIEVDRIARTSSVHAFGGRRGL
jgi:hypothetical protein